MDIRKPRHTRSEMVRSRSAQARALPAKRFRPISSYGFKSLATSLQKRLPWLMGQRRRFDRRAIAALALGVAGMAVLAIQLIYNDHYALDPSVQKLLGPPNAKLNLAYDSKVRAFTYNQQEAAAAKPDSPAAALEAAKKSQSASSGKFGGGADNYAVSLASQSAQGVRVQDTTDSTGQLALQLIPQFKTRPGKLAEGRVVYPLKGRSGQLIYSLEANGIKEDLVLYKEEGDTAEFTYKLDLPKSLEAKLMPNGAIGVYSADASLFGNITFGSDADQTMVEQARQKSPKTHLVFTIPAPVINQTGGGNSGVKAAFELNGNLVKVKASNLKNARYPLSIDPSIVVTSATDFTKGNQEGGVDFDAGNNQLKRGALTGATVPSWASADTGTPFSTTRRAHDSIIQNGYIYVIGGEGSGGVLADVQYAPINSNGTIGSWSATTSFPTARKFISAVAYNGYLYVMGGSSASNQYENLVEYAPINANGTVGAWSSTTGFTTARYDASAVAYNGYMYMIGGQTSSSTDNLVQYAPIKANGTLGSWTATTTLINSGRFGAAAVAYNGYIYVTGGCGALLGTCFVYQGDTIYAPINADGSLGSWVNSSNTFTTSRHGHTSIVANGYIYIMGGYNGSSLNDVQYAPIKANGSLGGWSTTASFTTARANAAAAAHNGYIYITGGCVESPNCGTLLNDTQYAKINSAGVTGNYTAANSFSTARVNHTTVAYNGYLYVIGGFSITFLNDVQYAPINANGTIGSWSSTTSFNTARHLHTSVAYNGYLYVMGGASGVMENTVEYAPINSNGAVGTWSSTTSFSTARYSHSSAVYNGYLYVIGGCNATTCGGYQSDVQYAPLNSNGTVGSWNTTTSLAAGRSGQASVAYGGYIYITGGCSAGDCTSFLNDVLYAPINTNGTIGSWSTTGSFTTGRFNHAMVVSNGYLYIIGGCNGGACSSYLGDVQYAPINTNGSVGTWISTVSLATARKGHGAAAANGYVYVTGGQGSGGLLSDVQYASLNNGGSGGVSSWVTDGGTSFSTARWMHSSVAHNGFLYVIGGFTGSGTNTVQYAPINADGSIGTWNTTTSFSTARWMHSSLVYNGYLYVIGGTTNATSGLNDVQYAPINSNGTVGTWNATTAFTTGRFGQSAVAYNGYLYVIGGTSNNSTGLSDVQYAPINSNGTVGTWNTTASFTTGRWAHGAVINNGYVYLLGGWDGATAFSDVQYAALNANGTVGSWSATTSLQSGRAWPTAVVSNGYLYVTGGLNVSVFSDVRYSPINAGGTLGTWNSTSGFSTGRYGHASAFYNGYIYISGGTADGVNGLNDVQYGGQLAIPRKGSYSILADLGGDALATKILYRGAGSGVSFTYKNATSSSATFGAASSLPLVSDSLYALAASENRYRWLIFGLDDSQNAVFPDSLGNPITISDFELYFHPAPGKRLRGGKTFTGEQQRSLDAGP